MPALLILMKTKICPARFIFCQQLDMTIGVKLGFVPFYCFFSFVIDNKDINFATNLFITMYRILLLLLILIPSLPCKAQRQFSVMTYNIENAFDTIHDAGKNDYEFLPDGERKWTRWRLFKKLKSIAKVIAAADEDRPIDLIAICEVENDSVMEYLTHRTQLNKLPYKYIITNSPDERGIDVALLYSQYTFHPVETQSIRHTSPEHPTRDILRVSGTIESNDTLDVYVVHLPSKRGGAAAAKRSRAVTQLLKDNIDSVSVHRQHPNIIVMGDFNAEPKSSQIKLLTKDNFLTDTSAKLTPGTYKYQGEWSVIDHILVHLSTLKMTNTFILSPPFLTLPDETNGGVKPFRTYLGPIYKGGVSDHLPVVLKTHSLPQKR